MMDPLISERRIASGDPSPLQERGSQKQMSAEIRSKCAEFPVESERIPHDVVRGQFVIEPIAIGHTASNRDLVSRIERSRRC